MLEFNYTCAQVAIFETVVEDVPLNVFALFVYSYNHHSEEGRMSRKNTFRTRSIVEMMLKRRKRR